MADRAGRAAVPVLLALVLMAQYAGVTLADHGGRPIGSLLNCDRPGVTPPRCTSVGNNLRHFVYFDATLTEGLASSLRDTLAEDYAATDLSTYVQTRLTLITDVIAYSQNYGDNGAAGWVYCPTDAPQGVNARGDRWCKHQELHLNLDPRYSAFFTDDASRDHVTCHELGHTLGLRHWGNPPQSAGPAAATCMNGNTPDGPVDLHQIDVDHINAYPYEPPRLREGIPLLRAPGATAAAGLRAWLDTTPEATQPEAFGSLRELARSADAVVRGRVIDVGPGRVFGDRSRAALHHAAAAIRVYELIAGSLPRRDAGELILEIPLFEGPESLAELESAVAGTDAIFFLRSKAESARGAGLARGRQLADEGFYRLVTFDAWVTNADGRATTSPDAQAFLASLDGLEIGDAARLIRDAGR